MMAGTHPVFTSKFNHASKVQFSMQRIFVILALGTMLLLMGNAPAPYYACQGKAAGDACTYGYGGAACSSNRGVCTISTSFTDNPSTADLNESLICVTK